MNTTKGEPKIRLLWDNLLGNSSLSSSTEDSDFVLSNIKNPHLTKIFKFTGNTSETLDINLGSSEEIRGIIVETNLTSSATVNIYGHTTSDFTIPDYTSTASVYDGKVTLFLDENYQYWRVEMTDTSLTTIWIKYLFIGDYTQMPTFDPDVDLEYSTSSTASTNQTGQIYGNKGYEIFSTGFEFNTITDYVREIDGKVIATREELLLMWRAVENINPIYLVIWEESLDKFSPVLGVFDQNSFTFSKSDDPGIWSLDFDFTETR